MHTHTSFCDGKSGVEDFCETAYTKDFVSLGFSAHAPPQENDIQSDWHLSRQNINAYIDAVEAARKKWRGKLDVYLGMEVDYIRGVQGPASAFYQNLPLDFIIGSVHCVPPPGMTIDWAKKRYGNKLLCIDGSPEEFEFIINEGFNGNAENLVRAYYADVRTMCDEGCFDILGHLDLITKNNIEMKFFNPNSEWYTREIDALSTVLQNTGITAEINTGGMIRGKTLSPYPSFEILRRLREKNVPVTLNADAHAPDHLGGFYEEALLLAKKAGFTAYKLFNGRRGKEGACWESEEIR
ncbi:MAG: histidinol-phosphatase [Spirochaetaceae bacterium]|nr:histidinol-phosphatase [Spirochaetaceae bacterium]